jgi:hypothetical protein
LRSVVLRQSLVNVLSVAFVISFSALAACDGCGSGSEEEEAVEAEAAEEAEASEDEAAGGDTSQKEKVKEPKKGAGDKGDKALTKGEAGGEVKAAAGTGDAEGAPAGALSPEVKRREEREERIAQLKRRNEERRKERLARHADKAEGDRQVLGERGGTTNKNQPVLDVSKYLSVQNVRTLTGERTLTSMGRLKGIETGEGYNSIYFAPSVRSNFGVSLQVWKERIRRDANQRYTKMRADFPNPEDTTALGGKSFISYFDDIISLTFADLTKRVIVSVSCSQKICTGDQLLSLANAVKEKL